MIEMPGMVIIGRGVDVPFARTLARAATLRGLHVSVSVRGLMAKIYVRAADHDAVSAMLMAQWYADSERTP